ncbi:Osmotin, thaumatin-like protein [Gymnopus androsaceus JB14]|uniref:Osmotin, thaumatin-like protein n=1 Tax=Gymnopus androsaceus JB14 TaxID=1447944 RepID=A0A6A4HY23_9AGAR|nr:Osmotin, thaumatin-like protein [Gymnopus androsaceus JB14]
MANARTMTVTSNCDVTVRSGMYTSGNSTPDYVTGWEATAGSSVSFTVPDDWTSGRIWGRTDCDFDNNTDGATACDWCMQWWLGICDFWGNGESMIRYLDRPLLLFTELCEYRVLPTVAEWTLGSSADWYDVSLVDGFNIPMEITNTANCNIASCLADLNTDCSNGTLAGCKSACDADLGGDASDSSACYTGSHTAEKCPGSGVPDYDYFKGSWPDAYAYPYDEDSDTALFTCDPSNKADYTLTCCP